MRIFIICSVRGASDEYRLKLEEYADTLKAQGHEVHLPHRDTNQKADSYHICLQNMEAIVKSDEVHIFYNSKSQGTHFDMGVAFAFNRKIVVVENEEYTEGKSFANMLREWESLKAL
jgi:nucleoside 2-deoxyribosyltransferase